MLVQFVDTLAVSITVTHLVSYAKTFASGDGGGVSVSVPVAVSLVSSLYGFSQLFAAPFVGKLGDQHGRRRVLALSLCCAALGYAVLACASSLAWLFASRVLVGLSKHTSDLSRAHVAAVTHASAAADEARHCSLKGYPSTYTS